MRSHPWESNHRLKGWLHYFKGRTASTIWQGWLFSCFSYSPLVRGVGPFSHHIFVNLELFRVLFCHGLTFLLFFLPLFEGLDFPNLTSFLPKDPFLLKSHFLSSHLFQSQLSPYLLLPRWELTLTFHPFRTALIRYDSPTWDLFLFPQSSQQPQKVDIP